VSATTVSSPWEIFSDHFPVTLPVQLGRRNNQAVEVLGGLGKGERVVLYPTDNVTDGVRAEVR
jgi:hypothetical protein